MNFGTWLKKMRHRQGLSLENLATQTGVEASTISRIESEQTQATLDTAVRLCEALGTTSVDLLQALLGRKFPPSVSRSSSSLSPDLVLTMEDVDAFIALAAANPKGCCRLLSDLLNQAAQMHSDRDAEKLKPQLSHLAPEDIARLLVISPLFRFQLHYPPGIEADMILDICRHGGALTGKDVGVYLQHARRKKKVTLVGLEDAVQLSASVLSRMETGAVERVKLMDVLALDQAFGEKGNLWAMYWDATRFKAKSTRHLPKQGAPALPPARWTEQEYRLAEALVIACRWLQYLGPGNYSWIGELRRELNSTPREQSG